MSFENLGLNDVLLKAVAEAGYETATEVQMKAIPFGLEGRDLMVSSSTGSGKTASFVLPGLQRILQSRAEDAARQQAGQRVFGPRMLVLAPTRELAWQVAKAASCMAATWRATTVVGGVPYPAQIKALGTARHSDRHARSPARPSEHPASTCSRMSNCWVLDEATACLTWASSMTSRRSPAPSHRPSARR